MNLSIFVIVPLLMLLGLWLARNDKQVRGVMVAGASVLLGLSIYLVFAFLEARETMPADQAPMLFNFMAWGTQEAGETIRPWQSGDVRSYAIWFLTGTVALTLCLLALL